MNIDERLRESLHHNASDAPAGVSLWEGVQARSRRLDRRRHAAAGAALTATAVTTGLVLSLPPLLREPSLSPGASTAAANGRLVPLSYTIPDFPYSPSWLPPGFSEPRVALYNGRHQVTYHGERGDILLMRIGDRETPSQERMPLTEGKTTVDGRPATSWVGEHSELGRDIYLIWERDGRWVTVRGHSTLTVVEVMKFANGLTPKAISFPMPFKLTLAPAGFTELAMTERAANERMLCVVPPQQSKQPEQMCVWLGRKVTPPASWTPPPYTPGGFGPLGTRRVTVDLNDGRTIIVNTTLPPDRLSDDEMREVATTLVLS